MPRRPDLATGSVAEQQEVPRSVDQRIRSGERQHVIDLHELSGLLLGVDDAGSLNLRYLSSFPCVRSFVQVF